MSTQLKILEQELEDLRASNRAMWNMYGSELCAGELSDSERAIEIKVEKLFICSHPVFGTIKDNGSPTVDQAFNAGKDKSKNNQEQSGTMEAKVDESKLDTRKDELLKIRELEEEAKK